MKEVLFSVILPTYNRAGFIGTAIASVLGQTYANWELIIVDDGSTDGTKEEAGKFKDARIRYFYREHAERSRARNYGIDMAGGDYICFLDSDDYYLKDHLENFYHAIAERGRPKAFFYCDFIYDHHGKLTRAGTQEEYDGRPDFVLRTTINNIQACIHSGILKEHRYNPEFSSGEDIELWVRIFAEYPVYHVNSRSAVVLKHESSTTGIYNTASYKANIRIFRYVFKKPHPGSGIPFRRKLYLWSALYFGIGRCHILNGRKWAAIGCLLRSLWLSPFVRESRHRLYLVIKLLLTPGYCKYYEEHELDV